MTILPPRTLTEADSQRGPRRVPHWRIVASHSLLTTEVLNYDYAGSGAEKDPYLVEFIPDDPRNPMLFTMWKKWSITILVAVATLAVAFVSSAYTGGVGQIIKQFGASQEVVTLGISLFVLGFAIGPLLWAPLSELYGRQVLFFGTYGILTAFNAAAAGSQNIQTLIILRFFAGAFGSSPLTNAGGVIADMFPASQRGLAMSVFAAAPFMGPTLGPIVGGFLGESKGWRWVEGLMAIFTGVVWIIGSLTIPETYPPVLLRKRAAALSKATGKVYRTKIDVDSGKTPSVGAAFKTALSRPWMLLFREPIVFLLSIYMAIVYGTLYMMFAAFPIVFHNAAGAKVSAVLRFSVLPSECSQPSSIRSPTIRATNAPRKKPGRTALLAHLPKQDSHPACWAPSSSPWVCSGSPGPIIHPSIGSSASSPRPPSASAWSSSF